MSSDSRDGWAIRRKDRCKDSEVGHGTWDPWVVCCPSGMKNTTIEDNTTIENNNTGCSMDAGETDFPTQCADPNWILYASDGYFCCDTNQIGFVNSFSYKGCAEVSDFDNRTMKKAVQMGQVSVTTTSSVSITSTSSSSVSTPTAVSTSTSEPSSTLVVSKSLVSQSSTTNTGAIAGGVVGGVCGAFLIVGAIWLFLRRRRRSLAASQPGNTDTSYTPVALSSEPKGSTTPPRVQSGTSAELYDNPTQRELLGSTQARHELS